MNTDILFIHPGNHKGNYQELSGDFQYESHLLDKLVKLKEEKPPYYFEYKKKTQFGRGMSMDEILENHSKLQSYCREKDLNY